MCTGFWWGNLREIEHLEDLGLDGEIILKWAFKKCDGGLAWIDLVQDRATWRTVLNTVMHFRFS